MIKIFTKLLLSSTLAFSPIVTTADTDFSLDDSYTEVKEITFEQGSYIDTDYTITSTNYDDIKLVGSFELLELGASNGAVQGISDNGSRFYFGFLNGFFSIGVGNKVYNTTIPTELNKVYSYSLDFSTGTYKVNGQTFTNTSQSGFTGNSNLILGSLLNNGSLDSGFSGSINFKSFELYENDVLKIDLCPYYDVNNDNFIFIDSVNLDKFDSLGTDLSGSVPNPPNGTVDGNFIQNFTNVVLGFLSGIISIVTDSFNSVIDIVYLNGQFTAFGMLFLFGLGVSFVSLGLGWLVRLIKK